MKTSCPSGQQPLTPTGRLAAMEAAARRHAASLGHVQPALAKFYGSLSDEQKAQINRLSGHPV